MHFYLHEDKSQTHSLLIAKKICFLREPVQSGSDQFSRAAHHRSMTLPSLPEQETPNTKAQNRNNTPENRTGSLPQLPDFKMAKDSQARSLRNERWTSYRKSQSHRGFYFRCGRSKMYPSHVILLFGRPNISIVTRYTKLSGRSNIYPSDVFGWRYGFWRYYEYKSKLGASGNWLILLSRLKRSTLFGSVGRHSMIESLFGFELYLCTSHAAGGE